MNRGGRFDLPPSAIQQTGQPAPPSTLVRVEIVREALRNARPRKRTCNTRPAGSGPGKARRLDDLPLPIAGLPHRCWPPFEALLTQQTISPGGDLLARMSSGGLFCYG